MLWEDAEIDPEVCIHRMRLRLDGSGHRDDNHRRVVLCFYNKYILKYLLYLKNNVNFINIFRKLAPCFRYTYTGSVATVGRH